VVRVENQQGDVQVFQRRTCDRLFQGTLKDALGDGQNQSSCCLGAREQRPAKDLLPNGNFEVANIGVALKALHLDGDLLRILLGR
jgi:hypothetical protein